MSSLRDTITDITLDLYNEIEFIKHDDKLLEQFYDKLLAALQTAVLAAAPEKRQAQFVKWHSPVTETEEKRCKFYRYGGFDHAIHQYTKALQQLFESKEPLQ